MEPRSFYAIARAELGSHLVASGFRCVPSQKIASGLYPRGVLWVKDLVQPAPPPAPERLIVCVEHVHESWPSGGAGAFRVVLEVGAAVEVTRLLDPHQFPEASVLQRKIWTKTRTRGSGPQAIIEESFFSYVDDEDVRAWLRLILLWLPSLAATLGNDPILALHFPGAS